MWWVTYNQWLALQDDVAHIRASLSTIRKAVIQMSVDYSRLRNDVAAQTSVISSVLVLIQGLQTLIQDLRNQLPDDSAAQAVLDEIDAGLAANTAALAAAVPVNTSATAEVAPTVVVPVEPTPIEPTPVEPSDQNFR